MSIDYPSDVSPEQLTNGLSPIFQLEPADGTIFGHTDHPDYPEALVHQIDVYGLPIDVAMQIERGSAEVVGTVLAVDESGRLVINDQSYPEIVAIGSVKDRTGEPSYFRIHSFVELDIREAI